jgi:hypothetical protein
MMHRKELKRLLRSTDVQHVFIYAAFIDDYVAITKKEALRILTEYWGHENWQASFDADRACIFLN